jgi:threonine/homoserine/homoserine lactone efflux protein
MLAFLTSGVVLGLSAGFSPGPLFALVVSQAMRHGVREGMKTALAPLLTDTPVILLSVLVLTRISGYKSVLGGMSLVGAAVVAYLAYEGLRATGYEIAEGERGAPRSLAKGVLVNFLSPHPYLFWLTVGGPMVLRGWERSAPAAAPLSRGSACPSCGENGHRRVGGQFPALPHRQGTRRVMRGLGRHGRFAVLLVWNAVELLSAP